MEIDFTLDEIGSIAQRIIKGAANNMLSFSGQMGSGKTTLIKSLVKELGGVNEVSSPTFGIVNEYHKKDGSLLGYHFDFYRLEDETEALDIGLEDYLNQDAWIFIEWPEKVESFLPEKRIKINIELIDSNTRKIVIS